MRSNQRPTAPDRGPPGRRGRGRRGALPIGSAPFRAVVRDANARRGMSRARPNILIVIPLLAAMGGALFIAHFMIVKRSRNAAERNTDETTVAAREQRAEPRGPGRVKLAITVPSDAGLTSVSYAVLSAEHVVVARGSAPVEAQTG